MSTIYDVQKSAIMTLLQAVPGIGNVYDHPKNVIDEKTFNELFDSNSKINVCWFSRGTGKDDPNGQYGEIDEENIITHTEEDDTWLIELYYSFQDGTPPSEDTFQELCDAIQNAFRFQQNLGGDLYERVIPCQRIAVGLFNLNKMVLCHKAVFSLRVIERTGNTSLFVPPTTPGILMASLLDLSNAVALLQPELNFTPENIANKSTSVTTDAASDIKYPSVKATKKYVDDSIGGTAISNTDELDEGNTNLYFTTARVLATVLSGLSLLTGGAIVSTDTVLIALGKLQNQISAVLSVVLTGLSTSSATAITATDSILVAFGKLQAQINNSTGGGFYWMPAFVPPVLADFAWVNQGGGSANNNGGIIFLYSPADSGVENLKCLVKNKSGAYTLEMFFIPTFRNTSYCQGGLVLRDSQSGRCIRFNAWQQNGYGSKLGVTYLNSPTSFNSDKISINTYYGASMIAFKIVVTSMTISYYYSFDCLNYILLFSDALNAWGTIDQIGLCVQAYNVVDPAAISCIHWKES